MPNAHPNGARTRPTPPTDTRSSRPLLRLDLAGDTPGWTLADEHGHTRPLTVRQAVAHAIDTDGPAAVVRVLGATRDALAELPEQTDQLRAELTTATPGLLADVDDGLSILRGVLDVLAPTAPPAPAPPDLMGELRERTRRLAARASTARRQLAADPMGAMLAAIGRTGGR